MSPIDIKLTSKGEVDLAQNVRTTELPSTGGSADITELKIPIGHVMYPGDSESDKGATTYIRTENPPQVHEVNLKNGDQINFEVWLPDYQEDNVVIQTNEYQLTVIRK